MSAHALPSPFDGKEIWFLTGSQDLYGEETLARVAEQSRQVAAWLDEAEAVPVPIVWKPVLKDRDAIRAAVLAANADDACIGVIAWMHTFSPAKMWIAGIDALAEPLLQLHTQYSESLPWSTIDMDYMNLNQAAHGDREFGYILSRLGRPRKVVVGHAAQAATRAKVGVWARAAAGWDALHRTRLVRFGDNMRNVAVTEGDKTEAELRLGASVNTWGVNDLVAVVDAVSEQEVDALVAEYLEAYDVVPELRPGGERHESLRYGARLEAGMRRFLESRGATAFTTNFEDLGGLRQLPGLAVQRLMADGYGFGAEGDWKTAILVRAAKVMGHGLSGGASLMEDYCYEMTPGKEKILGAHMLEVSPALTTSRPRLEIHPLGIGGREDPCRLVFTADPGPAVVAALSDVGPRFRLVVNSVDLIEPTADLPRLPVGRALWRPRPDFVTSAKSWLTAGAAHHTVMTTAVTADVFVDFARMVDVEIALIDEHTTVADFERGLRLEASARGLR